MEPEVEEMELYTLKDGTHRFKGQKATKGGRILLTSKEAGKLGDRVSRVVERSKVRAQASGSDEAGSVEIARDWSATQDMKAVEVIALANETTSVSELEALYEVEEKGQNRPSVLKAIEKKVTQLEGG